jgi:hypothetical protein
MSLVLAALVTATVVATVYDLRHHTQRIRVPEWEHLRS